MDAASSKKLVETKDIIKAAKMNKLGQLGGAKLLMLLLRVNKINELYEKIYNQDYQTFLDSFFQTMDIKFEVCPEELNRIPSDGAFITVSNHPYGGLDGLILLKILAEKRADYKLLVNFLLSRIEPLQDKFLMVNPFENQQEAFSGFEGIRKALEHLKSGCPLGLFPAGEVSTRYHNSHGITDRTWQKQVIKLIHKAKVPVVPIYFHGNNSRIFHLLGLIHPHLRTARLPSEILNKKSKSIKVRIGHPITVGEQEEFADTFRFGLYLRARTYALKSSTEVKKFFRPQLFRVAREEKIEEQEELIHIKNEIDKLKSNGSLLFHQRNFSVFCTPSDEIPCIINEIGRVREITFRKAGEGTNKNRDLDEYDIYYRHLFIWDNQAEKIVGAYRIGMGEEIIAQYGTQGFYLKSLFKISKKFTPVLRKSLELGRSFVVSEYQRKPLPLFLLWKGILYFLIKNPGYRYLIGPVSISNDFSKTSRNLMLQFLQKYCYNPDFAKYFKPRKKFRPDTNEAETILIEHLNDVKKPDKLIREIESKGFSIPVLLKKYLSLNGKIVGFNLDPKFNNCLDGLLILDLFDVPFDVISSLSKEIDDMAILERFAEKVDAE
ncbi:MAG: GNAT family N-acetyltransferase [Bacteroidetes bacterium]|jgi:putative hemolysin|nr:GNAT family N-acetyltransferase [Bacteroidota bacterium]